MTRVGKAPYCCPPRKGKPGLYPPLAVACRGPEYSRRDRFRGRWWSVRNVLRLHSGRHAHRFDSIGFYWLADIVEVQGTQGCGILAASGQGILAHNDLLSHCLSVVP